MGFRVRCFLYCAGDYIGVSMEDAAALVLWEEECCREAEMVLPSVNVDIHMMSSFLGVPEW